MTESPRPYDASGGVPALRAEPPSPEDLPRHRRLWSWWLGKAAHIAAAQNRLLSTGAYWLGLGPVALWMRWSGQDRLDRAWRPVGPSEWKPREAPIHTDPDRIRRPV